jgi:hypothetical protein
MRALDFVFRPQDYVSDTSGLPFTIPATAAPSGESSTVETLTKMLSAATPTQAAMVQDTMPTFNTSTPVGFLLYVFAQTQKAFAAGPAGGIFFGGPTRNYWMLTLLMVPYPSTPLHSS